jgi:hypothetical protein
MPNKTRSKVYWTWFAGLGIVTAGAVLISAMSFPHHLVAGIALLGVAVFWFWRYFIISNDFF